MRVIDALDDTPGRRRRATSREVESGRAIRLMGRPRCALDIIVDVALQAHYRHRLAGLTHVGGYCAFVNG